MSDVLTRIEAYKREEIAERKAAAAQSTSLKLTPQAASPTARLRSTRSK
jgi:hypothetical protein